MLSGARPKELVTIERVQRALITAATLVDLYGDECLPIFERLERELLAMERSQSAIERAKQISKRHATPLAINRGDGSSIGLGVR